jgi:hypothetical protein
VTAQNATQVAATTAAQTFTLPMSLPTAAAQPSSADVSQMINKTTAKDASAPVKNPDIASDSDNTATKSSSSSSASSDPSSQAVQNIVPSGQHAQAQIQIDPSQAAAVTSKAADTTAVQAQAVAAHTVAADATTAHRASSTVADTSAAASTQRSDAASQADGTEAAASTGINTSRVIQSMNETEMHVGMRSAEFGDISIRTSVSQQQMLAQISVDHTDLGQAIAAHVSTVQAKLGNEYGLHAQIEVSQQGSSFTGDSGQSSSQREQKPYANAFRIDNSAASASEADSAVSALPVATVSSSYRLDIQA